MLSYDNVELLRSAILAADAATDPAIAVSALKDGLRAILAECDEVHAVSATEFTRAT